MEVTFTFFLLEFLKQIWYPCISGVIWNDPQSMWKMYFSREAICIFIWKAPKSKTFIFGSFFILKIITCFFLWNAPFFWQKIGKISNKNAYGLTRKIHLSPAIRGISNYPALRGPRIKWIGYYLIYGSIRFIIIVVNVFVPFVAVYSRFTTGCPLPKIKPYRTIRDKSST